MKKITLFCLAFIVMSSMYSQVVTNGLIGYWALDGNLNDTAPAGNNWHGNLSGTGTVITSDRSGDPNTAYEFPNNISAKIVIPGVIRTTKSMAVSIWCYPTDLSTTGEWLINQRDAGANDQFQISYNSQGTFVSVDTGGAGFDVLQAAPLVPNQWNHIVLQTEGTNGSNLEAYINNVAQNPITLTGDMVHNISHEITVGQQGWSTSGQFTGIVDEIALFNRVLTATEVDDIYNHNNNPGGGSDGLWTDNGTNIYRLGKVAVNTETLPSGFDFAVDGKIVTKEVKVTLTGWADFVFEKDYQLPTLEEVEAHILKKGHLPSIPSAKEVEKEGGFSLGEMNKILLQKVEELTLYTIEQEKRIKALEEKLAKKKD